VAGPANDAPELYQAFWEIGERTSRQQHLKPSRFSRDEKKFGPEETTGKKLEKFVTMQNCTVRGN